MKRHPSILTRDKTGLLIIDIQEKIHAVMKYRDEVIENTVKLIKGFKVLGLPITITEQYRKGLGPTVAPILEALQPEKIDEKLTFSCCALPNFVDQLKAKNLQQIVVCGIETHVCVAQTCLDLLANDFQVYLAVDATSSRKKIDSKTAIRRLQQFGVVITTVEAVLFELLFESRTPEFKEISKIVK